MSKVKKRIEEELQAAGLKYQYRKYDEAPQTPYATWYIERESITGDDFQHRIRSSEIVIELHTTGKDFELEELLESRFPDCEIRKTEVYDDSENLLIVTFEFELKTKIKYKKREGQNNA